MSKVIQLLNKEVKVVRSKQSKYLKLSITAEGAIRLSAPVFVTQRQINNFIESQLSWIKTTLDRVERTLHKRYRLESGEKITILGQPFELRVHKLTDQLKVHIDREGKLIHIFGSEKDSEEKVYKAMRTKLIEMARGIILAKVDKIARTHNLRYARISIREQKTRWGSCSHDGNLNFNWKIMLAPESVFNYVICHELAHLVEHNHSSRFWDLVEKLWPNYSADRRWLKRNGHTLTLQKL